MTYASTTLKKSARSLTLAFLISGLAGATAITGALNHAAAQDTLTAAVIEGTCDDPGNVAADLRDLTAAEGGALTSFTTVDLALDELTGGDYAVVAGDPSDPTACGQVTGEGSDVYIIVTAQGDNAIGGVAWLRARDQRTQISLFVGEGLGGGGQAVNNGSDGDDDGPPEPPVDETPEPEPPVDETPEPSGSTETYTAATYGFTVTYDTDFWTVTSDEVFPTDGGPADYFVLYNDENVIQAEFVGFGGVQIAPADYIDNYLNGISSDKEYSNVAVRQDDEGNDIRGGDDEMAFIAIDFTSTGQSGNEINNVYHIVAWQKSGPEEMVVMIFQTSQREYNQWTSVREDLENGMGFPD